jgi:cation-transporting ATPase 13A1
MVTAVSMATEEMGPEALKEVVEFHRKVRSGEQAELGALNEEDPWAEMMFNWQQPFLPNLLNTVVFLVETSQIISVLFVNYKGRPWMKGVLENHALFLSLFLCGGGVGFFAWGIRPDINAMIHLAEFPNDEFRWRVIALVTTSFVGTFIWDHICTFMFSRHIFNAMAEEDAKTTLKRHLSDI